MARFFYNILIWPIVHPKKHPNTQCSVYCREIFSARQSYPQFYIYGHGQSDAKIELTSKNSNFHFVIIYF